MRAALVLCTVVWTAATAQTILPADQGFDFFHRTDYTPLRCSAQPIPPALDFSFRFHAGYTFAVPFSQFHGPDHSWTVVLRVRPELGGPPVYFSDRLDLPDSDIAGSGNSGGGFLLGEGTYHAALLVVDDQNRACRADWRIEAVLGPEERNIKVAIPPGGIEPISRHLPASAGAPADRPIGHLTVLLHAAPIASEMSVIQASDSVALLGSLAALLDLAPEKSVRLVVFNLDQQKQIYRHGNFTMNSMPAVQQAFFNLQLAKVDYHTLQNQNGYLDLLSALVKEELHAGDPSDVVVFLGPHSRLSGKIAADALEKPASDSPRFFYVEYQRPLDLPLMVAAVNGVDAESDGRRGGGRGMGRGIGLQPDDPVLTPIPRHDPASSDGARDSIASLVSQLKGKTTSVRSPADFARALRQIAAAGQRRP